MIHDTGHKRARAHVCVKGSGVSLHSCDVLLRERFPVSGGGAGDVDQVVRPRTLFASATAASHEIVANALPLAGLGDVCTSQYVVCGFVLQHTSHEAHSACEGRPSARMTRGVAGEGMGTHQPLGDEGSDVVRESAGFAPAALAPEEIETYALLATVVPHDGTKIVLVLTVGSLAATLCEIETDGELALGYDPAHTSSVLVAVATIHRSQTALVATYSAHIGYGCGVCGRSR